MSTSSLASSSSSSSSLTSSLAASSSSSLTSSLASSAVETRHQVVVLNDPAGWFVSRGSVVPESRPHGPGPGALQHRPSLERADSAARRAFKMGNWCWVGCRTLKPVLKAPGPARVS